ncbi:hypothetical protein Tco_0651675 [Tanacetum coccineum]|uniref:Uncharacterized protein n=1 Tax=Tanacetum coccineum TaxID=301880 RepID=A0ABQ4WVG4_9ASTR
MLNIFESIEQKVAEKSPKDNVLQTEIDRLLEVSLTQKIRDYVIISVQEQKNEMLRNELEKSSGDSKDIQANLLKRIKILENDFKRSQAQRHLSSRHGLTLKKFKKDAPCQDFKNQERQGKGESSPFAKAQGESSPSHLLIRMSSQQHLGAQLLELV